MRKSEALNTFTQGLVMDINPLVAPNDGLCNALNATIITMNGNENVLQNDMGNGRVETAFLPEGYIPLGTAQLSGIIYIVSYNPLNKKCQIGSFPSPERNIEKSDIGSNVVLELSDFGYKEFEGCTISNVQKILDSNIKFNPGDRFIVTGTNIQNNYPCFYNENDYIQNININKVSQHTIKVNIGVRTNSGDIIIFNNLKEYKIPNIDDKFIILEHSSDSSDANVDDYRSIIEQPYNVFQSKVSGNLVLICELVQPSSFSVNVENIIDEQVCYVPNINMTLQGTYPFVPNSFEINVNIDEEQTYQEYLYLDEDSIKTSPSKLYYSINFKNFLSNYEAINILNNSNYFKQDNREQKILFIEITPCMSWGKVEFLKQIISIDLSKIGTGDINLTRWRYYNNEDSITLNWGLEIYQKDGYTTDSVLFNFYNLSHEEPKIIYTPKRDSYFGQFMQNIEKGEEENQLKSNTLYLAEIVINQTNQNNDQIVEPPVRLYRWLYTNTLFNEHYYNINDFVTQTIPVHFNVLSNQNTSITRLSKSENIQGINKFISTLTEEEINKILKKQNTVSYIENNFLLKNKVNLKIALTEFNNTFGIRDNKEAFSIQTYNEKIEVNNNILYTQYEDSDKNQLIESNYFFGPYNNDNFFKTRYSVNYQDISMYLNYYSGTATLKVEGSKDVIGHYRLYRHNLYIYNFDKNFIITNNTITEEGILQIQYNNKNGVLILDLKESDSFTPELATPSYSILAKDTNVEYNDDGYLINNEFNIYEYVKAYSSLVDRACTFQASFRPYINRDNLQDFNIQLADNKFYPMYIVGMRCNEDNNGYASIGLFKVIPTYNDGRFSGLDVVQSGSWQDIGKGSNITFNWLSSNVQIVCNRLGLSGKICIIAHIANTSNSTTKESGVMRKLQKIFSNGSGYGTIKIFLGLFTKEGSLIPIQYTTNLHDSKNMVESMKTKRFETYMDYLVQSLNNIYIYVNNSVSERIAYPDNIMYTSSQNLSMFFNVSISINTKYIDIILNDTKTSLSTYLEDVCAKHKIDYQSVSSIQNIQKNITCEYHETELNKKFTINIENTTDGDVIRNIFLSQQKTMLDKAIIDFDNSTILGEYTGTVNPTKLYTRNGSDIVQANSFNPIHMKYIIQNDEISEIIPGSSVDHLVIGSQNLNNELEVKDQTVVVANPNSGWSCTRGGINSRGIYTGFQKVKFGHYLTGKLDIYNNEGFANYEETVS